MILMWLGHVVVAIAALFGFGWAISNSFYWLQKRFLALPEKISIFKMLVTTKQCGIGLGSFLRTQYSAVALLNSRSFSRRHGILLMCLSSAGTWTTMLMIALAWQMGGQILTGISLLLFIYSRWKRSSLNLFYICVTMGAVLIGLQGALEKQSILMSVLGEGDLHFLLADGRFSAQLLWLVVSFVVTLILGVESWAVFLSLVLVVAGSLSLNGAVAFIIGEMLAHVWMLWWRSRKLNQDVRALTKGYAIYSTLGLVLAFFAAGILREAFVTVFTFEGNQLTEKSWQFFSFYFLIVVIQALTVMTWGHFAAKIKVEEVQTGEYFPIDWISRTLVSNEILDFILKKLNGRLDLLLAQKKDLDSKDRAQIPAAFLKEHEREMTQLALWLPLATECRNNRKS